MQQKTDLRLGLETLPRIHIDQNAIYKNFLFLRQLANHSQCSAVVKNNAYGLGLSNVIKVLIKSGCQFFWVAHAIEALELRQYIKNLENIFVLQGFGTDNIDIFINYKFTPVINTLEQFYLWHQNKHRLSRPIIHLDTGLNRLGLKDFEWQYINLNKKFLNSEIKLLMSHLACADSMDHFMNQYQRNNFITMTSLTPDIPKSLAASDGLMLGGDYLFDMVRVGAAIYGINTSPYRENQMHPVIKLEAPILQIKALSVGEYVGYGSSFRAHKPKKIAMLSIGYADGLPRSLGNTGKAWIDGYEARYAGRISMDVLTIDVTSIPDKLIYPGKMVELINNYYTADDMGNDAGTIGYEIISNCVARSRCEKIIINLN